jgi:hypothetical protein
MLFKKSKENEEFQKEIQFNEAIDKKLKMGFDAAFKKGNVDSCGKLELIPTHVIQREEPSPWLNPSYKNWMLFAFAGIAFVVLLVLILTNPGHSNHMHVRDEVLPMISAAELHSSNHILNASASDSQPLMVATPSTTTTSTTEAPKVVDYILASIIVNNASVPQMDKTLLHQYSRADPYVVLYIIEGQRHRRVGKTHVDKNTLSPRWNYLFEHEMKINKDSLLNFEIWDKDNFNSDELIGKLYVKVEDLMAQEVNGQMIRKSFGRGSLWFTAHWRPVYKN